MQQGAIVVQALSKILKELRISQGLTQELLAEDLGLTRYMVSYYEGGREPPLDVLVAYAKRFNVSGDYLMGLSVEKRHEETDLSAMLAQLASLTVANDGTPLYMDDITKLLTAMISYYKAKAPAGHAPLEAVRDFLRAMPPLLEALSQNDTAATLDGVNKIAYVALSANEVLKQYLSS